ncbi:ABC transporter permease subunit [Rubritalea tangerina]|uniref:ABC transporter permease subunit n=1 Tax=Rubritalea tangerina TaxID=430798 RepID=A0ABW4ZFS6_9BACT
MMIRKFGWFLVVASLLAMIGEALALQLPTLRWPFNTAREMPGLSMTGISAQNNFVSDGLFPYFGWLLCLVALALGVVVLKQFPAGSKPLPIVQRRIQRFKSVRRGYVSFLLLMLLVLLAALDQSLVGKRALFVSYEGKWYFPAFERKIYSGKDFGQQGDARDAEASYRDLKKQFAEAGSGNFVLMPLVPYDPTGDTITQNMTTLEIRDGKVIDRSGKPFNGLASYVFDADAAREHIRFKFRKGVRQGEAEGRDTEGKRVFTAVYADDVLVTHSLNMEGVSLDAFMGLSDGVLRKIYYNPAPPLPKEGHWLGTNSSGNDILAYLYGGLQVNIKAAVIYVPIIYSLGVTIGLLMGLFGGKFDLIVQRIIEMFSNIPQLFVVIIFSSVVPVKLKGLGIILVILVCFGWMGMTYLMRTAALKEKARDYVAAARVSGASTSRIVFKHILPNTVAILVTLVPFSVSGIIMSLTALDYLGFGLPENYATWGRLLNDGLSKLSAPWIVSSAFVMLVTILVLVTFVGEAVRDAFDPKKFTTYK